ncbi:aspartate kinase [Schnuerera sp. xch1]|uniref:aspartate kinase n=1 Tax=Schnuerera sp. xch1 TaxID=2874283 RepID=UPI001CBF78FA|nr:aspartate kinase [Schnuerera sp. xch1]MBZ2174769.1 aspartate kinase [Schnuerera sp. xch1]
MGIIVQKFGGTSLRNLNNKPSILKHIKECINSSNTPVIVVSAMGRKGDPYATDTLIRQLEQINNRIDSKKKDLIMSCGETISASVVSHLLEVNNIPSEPLTGFQAGILTDDNFNSAEIMNIDVWTVKKYIREGKVVVIAGFQGVTKNKEITTLGRGGSDITAIALGGHLKAERVDIFTDVPGVAIIDPKIVPYTRYIKKISFADMYNLTSNGVKVMHPKAVEIANKFNIPVRVTSAYLNLPGTLISNENSNEKIIGIAINHKEEHVIFTTFFNIECRDTITKDFKNFYTANKKDIVDMLYDNRKISIITNTNNIPHFAQQLYNNLIK